MAGIFAAAVGLLVVVGGTGRGQEADPHRRPSGDPPRPAAEVGIRFTPGMARAMARAYVEDVVVRRYGLDESRVEEAVEMIARRVMVVAHTLDAQDYRETLENAFARIMEAEQQGRMRPGRPGMDPQAGRAFAEAARPLLPLIRELCNGAARDLRPMLSPSQQLKMAGDLITFNTALDGFSQAMDRWIAGDVRPFDDPFSEQDSLKRDAQGRTQAYQRALKAAAGELEKSEVSGWQGYVEDAKRFYQFDESQAAVADSILRESLQRAEAILKSEDYREQVLRNRVWYHMLWHLRIGLNHPIRRYLEARMEALRDPIEEIRRDLQRRIDDLPTFQQRQAAERRILERLAEKGYTPDFIVGRIGPPAVGPNGRPSSAGEGETPGEPPPPPPHTEEGGGT